MSVSRLEEAKRLAASGKLKEAADLLKGILQSDPDNADVRSMLVDLQDKMMLELQINEMLKRASAQADKGDEEAAGKIVAEILKISPGHAGAQALASRLSGAPQPAVLAGSEEEPGGAPSPGGEPGEAPVFEVEQTEPLLQQDETAETADFVLEELEAPAPGADMEQTVISGASSSLSPAELAKIKQYMQEGQAHFDDGRYQDAIDAWTRIFIIDEENQEAQAMIDRAHEAMTGGQHEVEHQLTEAIAYFNAGDMGRAKGILQSILNAFPGHREALYYMGRISEGAQGTEASSGEPAAHAAPEPSTPEAPAPPMPPVDDFELEDSLTVPTGPEMRAGGHEGPAPADAPSEFSFDEDAGTGGFELETGGVDTPPPVEEAETEAAEEPSKPAFELETGAADEFTFSDLGKDVGADTAQETPKAASGTSEFGDFVWDQPLPPPSSPVEGNAPSPAGPAPAGPPTAPPPAAAPEPAAEKPGRKGFSPPSASLLIIVVAGLLVISLGIFFGARLFLGGSEPEPAAVAPKLPRAKHPKPTPKPAPPAEKQAPEKNVQTMSTDDILAEASSLMAQKNYQKAITLYQEVLGRDAVNSNAQKGIRQARAALIEQQKENERNEKFLKDLGYSINSFKEQDYAESLRVAWRLIYPDDSLARELGKRETVRELIRDGYYNWAVQDLRRGNIRGAQKNLHDLLEFDSSDKDAAKLETFAKRYTSQQLDDAYNAVVSNLKYRSLSETP